MLRFCLRLLALLLLAAAFAALVVDGTRAIAAGAWRFSSLDATLAALSPGAAPALLAHLPGAWRGGAATALAASPTCLVLGVAGALLFALVARRRPPDDGPRWSA